MGRMERKILTELGIMNVKEVEEERRAAVAEVVPMVVAAVG